MRGTNSNKQKVMKRAFCIFFLFLHWQKTRNRNSGKKYTQLLQRLRHFMFKGTKLYRRLAQAKKQYRLFPWGVGF